MKRKRMVFLPLLFLIFAFVGFLTWARYELHRPVLHAQEGQYIEIPRGSTPDEIINRLSDLGVIRKLEEGEQRLGRLTIIEGWTRWDIAAQLARIPELKLRSADEALQLFDDTSAIRDLDPEAKNLEGYLYPDTYSFPPDATPKLVIETMVRRFRQVWGDLNAAGPAQGLTS